MIQRVRSTMRLTCLQAYNTLGKVKKNNSKQYFLQEIKEATIVKWHVKLGDVIEEFQTLADVQTDKMFTQIPSMYRGKVNRIIYAEDEFCQVGDVLLEIDVEQSEQQAQPQQQQAQPFQQHAQPKMEKKESKYEVGVQKIQNKNQTERLVSPAARALILQYRIDRLQVVGSGRRGLIMKEDIIDHMNNPPKNYQANETTESSKEAQSTLNNQRDINKIPALYLHDEYDVTNLLHAKAIMGVTLNSIIIKLLSEAIKQYPIVNSKYDTVQPTVSYRQSGHNIANYIGVQRLSIQAIHAKQNLQAAALPTIAFHNYGKHGPIQMCMAPDNPMVCSVSFGRIFVTPGLDGRPNQRVVVSFGADHRVLDGATVTRFSNALKTLIENPSLAILNLR